MLQTSNYSLVLSLQFLLLSYDLFVNSFSELLRMAPVIQLVLFIIQDITILFNVIIIFLMFFNTFVFQAGLVNLLFHKFKGTIILSATYLALSISFHIWVMECQTGGPWARYITCKPQPPQFCEGEKHHEMSCDGNVMLQVGYSCHLLIYGCLNYSRNLWTYLV